MKSCTNRIYLSLALLGGMSPLRLNIIANLIGNGWCALLSIATIPFYIYFMGIESYALIGIHITLMAVSAIMDMGMSTTINREMARLTSLPDKAQEAINLVRTMEVINWIMAVFIGLLIVSLAHPIAYYWVKPGALTVETVQQAIILMGFSMVFQWPFSFYSGGFIGLQKQVLLNGIIAGMATLRSAGVILVLWLVSPTIQAFLIWQIAVNALQFFTLATLLKKNLPKTEKRAIFQLGLISSIWRFAAGMGGISIMSMIMSQMDKLILSKLLSLETFGYYTLASVVATSFSRLMGPLVTAIFPRFNQLIVLGDMEKLKQLYHSGCQIMSVLIMPFTFLIVFFSSEILQLWTQDPVTAEKTSILVVFLAIGTMFNGLAHLPLSLQYSYGRTRMVFYTTAVTTITMTLAILLATQNFGAVGAAAVLMIINMVYTLLITHLIHRNHFTEEKRDWYIRDIGIPLIVTLTVMGIGRMLVQGGMSTSGLVLSLTAITTITVCAVAYSASAVRNWLIGYITSLPQKIFYGI